MKRLLFVVYEPANFQLGLSLAVRGREDAEFCVIFWSPYSLPQTNRMRATTAENGSVYICETTETGSLADIWTPMSGWLSSKPAPVPITCKAAAEQSAFAAQLLPKLDESLHLAALRAADACARRIAFCEDIIVRLGIDAVVMAEDNPERDSFAWLAAARRRGIPTSVISYGALSPNEAEDAYAGSQVHAISGPTLDLFRRHLPKWIRSGLGYSIARLPPAEVLGRELAGCSPRDPWLVNTGDIGAIGLESEVMLNIYQQQDFEPDRLLVVGHPIMDRLHAQLADRDRLRSALLREHGFSDSETIVGIAMPPNQTAHRPYEFGSYESVQDAFMYTARQIIGAPVFVSPHPNATEAERSRIAAHGFPLVAPAADLIPLCDLYIASVSTTIKWALACGVPVVDYDIFGYRYGQYLGLRQVAAAYEHSAFSAALQRWANSEERRTWSDAATRDKKRWGVVDGHCVDRCVKMIWQHDTALHVEPVPKDI